MIELFDVIVADPPWRYAFSNSKSRRIENQYETMTPQDIKALGPRIPAAPRSVLFLWCPAPKLPLGLEVMAAWGFEFKTQAVWDKKRLGRGYWRRGRHENVFIGTRGRFPPPPTSLRFSSVIEEARSSVHSRKPELFMRQLDETYHDLRKLELFARGCRPGWLAWGNEATDPIELLPPCVCPGSGSRTSPETVPALVSNACPKHNLFPAVVEGCLATRHRNGATS